MHSAFTEGVAVAFAGPCGSSSEQVPAVAALADEVFDVPPGWMIGHYPTLFRGDNSAWLRTSWDGGRPISLVAVWRGEIESFGRRFPVARVGMVATRPEYRGRGLAGALLRDALARLQAHGTALVIISGRGALYRRAGSRIFGDLREFFVDAAALVAGPISDFACVAPQAPDAAVLSDMAHLHEREPVRYVRSAEDWRLLLPAKGYLPPSLGRGTVLVRRGARTVAYALWDEGGADDGVLGLTEFAGERSALPVAVGWMLRHTGRARARLRVQPTDTPALRWAQAAGANPTPGPNGHSARVLDAETFLECLASVPGPGPDSEALRTLMPQVPIGSAGEPERAAAFGQIALGPGPHALPLPRTDGPNYI